MIATIGSRLIAKDGTVLAFDSVERDEFRETAEVPSHPVEGVVDHIERVPLELEVRAIVTETPIRARADDVLSRLPEGASGAERWRAAVRWINEKRLEPFDYLDARGIFRPSLALGSMTYAITREGRAVLELRFTEVILSSSQLVSVPPERVVPAKARGGSADDAGPGGGQSLIDRTSSFESDEQTAAAALYGTLGGSLGRTGSTLTGAGQTGTGGGTGGLAR